VTQHPTRLARRLGVSDAVVVGLGSMIGAGIFSAAGPAAGAAGRGLLLGVVIAAALAFLNATTMAQLARIYPESGGAYVYGRKRLGRFWGYLAGWGFVVGKLASCGAMALTFGHYAAPDHARSLAVVAVLLLSTLNCFGVKKTAILTKLIVGFVLLTLLLVVWASLGGGAAKFSRFADPSFDGGVAGILQASGMMFFAFAGYARIATLGEEVADPQRTIPRAILLALGTTVVVYFVVIATAILCVDLSQLADAKAPLVLAVESGRFSALAPVVRLGASVASVGVLLSLLAGVSRTTFAMAANKELPAFFSVVHPIYQVPHRAELFVGLVVAAVVSVADIRTAIGFSSFAILGYYAIANVAAVALKSEERQWPQWMSVAGLVSCLTIAFSLPRVSVVGGVLLFIVGSILYLFTYRRETA